MPTRTAAYVSSVGGTVTRRCVAVLTMHGHATVRHGATRLSEQRAKHVPQPAVRAWPLPPAPTPKVRAAGAYVKGKVENLIGRTANGPRNSGAAIAVQPARRGGACRALHPSDCRRANASVPPLRDDPLAHPINVELIALPAAVLPRHHSPENTHTLPCPKTRIALFDRPCGVSRSTHLRTADTSPSDNASSTHPGRHDILVVPKK